MNPLASLHDIYHMHHVPWWQTPIFYNVIAVVIIIVCMTAFFLFIRWFKRKKSVLMPWQIAERELSGLQQQIGTAQGKELYFALTSVLKNYLEQRYSVSLRAKTDDECVQSLTKVDFPQELIDPLRALFNGSLMVKFANEQALKEQLQKDFSLGFLIIKKTIPLKQ